MTKPFLLLQVRPEDIASHDELETMLKFGGLNKDQVKRLRLEKGELTDINLADYSGVIVGGGPYNVSDAQKPPEQVKLEDWLHKLLDEIVEQDFPYMGECYGLGILAQHLGGKVSKEKYGEAVGPIDVNILPAAKNDAILKGFDTPFRAFVGHKEACQELPPSAVHLASSKDCLIQMIRVKQNIYATQFHPTLDAETTSLRIKVYKHAGYFEPHEADELIEKAMKETITTPAEILKRFVERHSKS